jgi:hypothetical protein
MRVLDVVADPAHFFDRWAGGIVDVPSSTTVGMHCGTVALPRRDLG